MHLSRHRCRSFILVLAVAMWTLNVDALGQTCSDPGLQSVLRVFSEYSDAKATCEVAQLLDGDVEYVQVRYDAFPGVYSFVTAQPAFLRWMLYVSPADASIHALLNEVEQNPSSFWTIGLDGDGDVEFGRLMEPLGDVHVEAEFVEGTVEVFGYLSAFPPIAAPQWQEEPTLEDVEPEDFYEKSVQGCMRGVYSEWEGQEIPEGMNVRGYCECIADKLMSDPDRISDMFNASSEGLNELIEGCMDVLMPGLEDVKLDDFDDDLVQDAVKKGYMRGCLREAQNQLVNLGLYDESLAEEYCLCMYDNMRAQDSFKISDLEDENSVLMTEIDAACSHILMGSSVATPTQYWNELDGCGGVRTTPYLLNSVGEVKVKVSFDGTEKYLTLDSGCTEVILNEDLAKELKISGVIGPGDYLGLEMFILADGREVAVEKYRLSEMTVGSCVLRDFVVGVMEEGGMLLGMGYLGLFDSWELDQSTQTLRTRN